MKFIGVRKAAHVILVASFILVVLPSIHAFAAGPASVATIDRASWSVNSAIEFDEASLAENVAFSAALFNQIEIMAEQGAEKAIGVKRPVSDSLERWQAEVLNRVVKNIGKALQGCSSLDSCKEVVAPSTVSGLKNFSAVQVAKLSNRKKQWYASAEKFYAIYTKELLRLAALFPKTTSEILGLHAEEVFGHEMEDKSFLLTFDDGPTKAAGETDKIAEMLRAKNINAMFFIMEPLLSKRIDSNGVALVKSTFEKHCLGVHGLEHKPHPKMVNWRESIDLTWSSIKRVSPESKLLFRPPYGQRSEEITQYVLSKKGKMILWNIDSQDWSSKITSEQVDSRVISLMLLWRKGIVLFHDVHTKASASLPSILSLADSAKLSFKDCRKF